MYKFTRVQAVVQRALRRKAVPSRAFASGDSLLPSPRSSSPSRSPSTTTSSLSSSSSSSSSPSSSEVTYQSAQEKDLVYLLGKGDIAESLDLLQRMRAGGYVPHGQVVHVIAYALSKSVVSLPVVEDLYRTSKSRSPMTLSLVAAYVKLGEYEKARRVLATTWNHAAPGYNRAIIGCALRKDKLQGLWFFDQMLWQMRLQPQLSAHICDVLHQLLRKSREDLDGAINQILSAEPSTWQYQKAMWLYARRGAVGRTRELFQRMIELDIPISVSIRHALYASHVNAGDYEALPQLQHKHTYQPLIARAQEGANTQAWILRQMTKAEEKRSKALNHP